MFRLAWVSVCCQIGHSQPQRGMIAEAFLVAQVCTLTAQLADLFEKGMGSGYLSDAAVIFRE